MDKLFKSGEHTQLLGDSTKLESYTTLLDNQKANFLFADPPYCLLTRRNKKGKLRDQHKAKINHEAVRRFENVKEYRLFTESWMIPATKFLNDDATICIWTNFLGKEPIKQTAEKLGFTHFLGEFVWVKPTKEGGGNEILARIYEVALIFSKHPPKQLSPSDASIPWAVIGHYDDNKTAQECGNHPNHKPFNVLEPLIRTYTNAGDRILEPFSGSGSTAAAAISLDRIISCIEIRNEWARMTRDRIKKANL